MKKITVKEKHEKRKAMFSAQKIRTILSKSGVKYYPMTPNIEMIPFAFINHNFTQGNDSE